MLLRRTGYQVRAKKSPSLPVWLLRFFTTFQAHLKTLRFWMLLSKITWHQSSTTKSLRSQIPSSCSHRQSFVWANEGNNVPFKDCPFFTILRTSKTDSVTDWLPDNISCLATSPTRIQFWGFTDRTTVANFWDWIFHPDWQDWIIWEEKM